MDRTEQPVLTETFRVGGAANAAVANPARISRPGYALFLLMLAYLLSFFDRQILILMVGPIHRDMLLTDTEFGLLYGSAFVVFYALIGLVLGRIVDAVNRTKVLAVSVLLWSIATAACGLAQSFHELLLARAFLGIGEAGLAPAAYSLIADMYPPQKRGMAFSIYGQGIYLGAGLAFALGGSMVAFFDRFKIVDMGVLGAIHGWQVAFLVAAAPGLAVAILIAALREPARNRFSAVESMTHATLADGGFLAHYWRNLRVYIPHNLGYSLFMAQCYAMSVWLPSFFIRARGWNIADIGITYGLFFLIFAPAGSVLGGALASRYLHSVRDAYFRFSAFGFAILAIATLATVLVENTVLSLVFMALAISMIGFPTGLNAASLQMITPARFRGIAAGTFFAFSNLIGLGLGPLAVAAITDYVFHNPKLIGLSLGLTGLVVLPVAATILWRTRHLFAHTADEAGAGVS